MSGVENWCICSTVRVGGRGHGEARDVGLQGRSQMRHRKLSQGANLRFLVSFDRERDRLQIDRHRDIDLGRRSQVRRRELFHGANLSVLVSFDRERDRL